MKSKLVRRILIGAVILLCLVFLLTQCRKPEIIAEFDLYSIGVLDGQYYLITDVLYQQKDDMYSTEVPPSFDSIYELVDSVTNGKLTKSELERATLLFPYASRYGIEICNFDNLCQPVFPEGFFVSEVEWNGMKYSVHISETEGSSIGNLSSIQVVPEDEYRSRYQYHFENQFEDITIDRVEHISDRNAEVIYWDNESKINIRYSFQQEETKYTVNEFYNDESSLIPRKIDIYMENGDYFAYTTLLHPTERPSEEWLREFNLEKYEHPSSQ